MPFTTQITFRHMESSPALEERIRKLIARLDKVSSQITHCHVLIETPHQHKDQGNLFEVHIDATVPDKTIVIRRAHPKHPSHENVYVALRDAFNALRKRLHRYERKRQQQSGPGIGSLDSAVAPGDAF